MNLRWEKDHLWVTRFDRGWAEFRGNSTRGYWWSIYALTDDEPEPKHVTHAWEAKRAIMRAAEERGWKSKGPR